ncbi:alcohol dehydrogenase GroES domain-containing protein [Hyaloraphidium curvatum]|nr:alcohol dehydrogenase GroES domain-containing protein [Hyaloraphidium curvatum]
MSTRAVVFRRGTLVVEPLSEPPGRGVVIRPTAAGICGSDLHALQRAAKGQEKLEGRIFGHEFGGYDPSGRLVAVRPPGSCGECSQCKKGRRHLCRTAGVDVVGFALPGGMAEAVKVPEDRLVPMPAGFDPRFVGLVEPVSVVIHGINLAAMKPGDEALVYGAGSIGLLCAAALVDRGHKTKIVAKYPHQEAAARKLGAEPVKEAGKNAADVSFDCIGGSQEVFDACIRATRPGGSLVELGDMAIPITVNAMIMVREIKFIPSIAHNYNRDMDEFVEAAELLKRKPAIYDAVVTHRFPIHEGPKAFEVAADKTTGAIKVQLYSELPGRM